MPWARPGESLRQGTSAHQCTTSVGKGCPHPTDTHTHSVSTKKKNHPQSCQPEIATISILARFFLPTLFLIHLGVALIIRVKVVTKIPGNFAFKHWKIVSCVENPGFTQELVCGGKANCPFLFFPVPFQGGR